MSQMPPHQPQAGQNPFAERPPESPFGPGGPYASPVGMPPPALEDNMALRWIVPIGHSLWAIAAGYLGLFSLVCFPAPLALFCSLMAIRDLRRNPRLSGWGRAILGLVLGTLGTIGLSLGILAALFGK